MVQPGPTNKALPSHDGHLRRCKKGEPILPSDLQTSIAMRRQYPSFDVEAPALQYIAFMAKHGPFKDALVARWGAIFLNSETEFIVHASACHMESLKSLDCSCPMTLRSFRRCNANDLRDSDLDCMILILQLVALDIKDIDCKHWNCNVGHGNCYYSTPMLFLSRFLGVIVQRGGMVAPCALAAYSVCREKLRKCHAAGEVLNALPTKVGLTLVVYANI